MKPALPPGYRWRLAANTDGTAVREVVFGVLAEYGLRPDPDGVDRDLFQLEETYFGGGGWFGVLLSDSSGIVGTMGLLPVAPRVAELRKMYLRREHRGRGLGRALIESALEDARRAGVERLTLETASVLREAVALYQRFGFRKRPEAPHTCRCDLVMDLDLG